MNSFAKYETCAVVRFYCEKTGDVNHEQNGQNIMSEDVVRQG